MSRQRNWLLRTITGPQDIMINKRSQIQKTQDEIIGSKCSLEQGLPGRTDKPEASVEWTVLPLHQPPGQRCHPVIIFRGTDPHGISGEFMSLGD